MVVVVPVEEHAAVPAGLLDVVEPVGELGPVLQRLEVSFAVRVVAGGVRARMCLRDPEIREEERDRLGALRAAAIGVQRQDLGGDLLLLGGLLDQRLRELAVLPVLHGPADDVAAEHVEDHVQIEVRPLRRALQLGDVPAPQLVRPLGQQLRLGVRRMRELIATFPHAAMPGFQQPVHRPHRRQVAALVQQRGVHLLRRTVHEPLRVQHLEYRLALLFAQRPGRRRPRSRRSGLWWSPPTVDGCGRGTQRAARRPGAYHRRQLLNGLADHRPVLPGSPSVPSICSKSAETFPWISITFRAFASSASARSARSDSSAICASRRSLGLRPRGRPSSFSAPSRRCLRQYVKCDVYSPSRRSSSPTSPGAEHASALARISSLYFAVNDRRLACSASSGSGTPARAARPPAPNPSSPTSRWSSRPAAASSAALAPFVLVSNILALLRSRPQRSLIPRW